MIIHLQKESRRLFRFSNKFISTAEHRRKEIAEKHPVHALKGFHPNICGIRCRCAASYAH